MLSYCNASDSEIKDFLALSKEENLAQLSLREMASRIGMPEESPQKIKHHLMQLQKKEDF